MALSFCVLGSGSAGNATVVLLHRPDGPPRLVLIDAGMSHRQSKLRMAAHGLDCDAVEAILVTHLDRDHLGRGWLRAARRLGIPIRLHRRHADAAVRGRFDTKAMEPFDGAFELGDGTRVTPVATPHDWLGTTGFRIEHAATRLGFATDLGRIPDALVDAFCDLDALAIESNYDRTMQLRSDRPRSLVHRILSGHGHLSNRQALDGAVRIADRSSLQHLVLLHLSRDCNDPQLVRQLYVNNAPHLLDRLTISTQHETTAMLDVSPGRTACAGNARTGAQLELFPAGSRPITARG
jgi:phosphoribosyl 1,2-cyclic phosphodiesterase